MNFEQGYDEFPKQCVSNKLLSENPEIYLKNLEVLSKIFPKDELKTEINYTDDYDTWYSSSIICLLYLTGTLVLQPNECIFYGSKTEISNDLAIKILDKLLILGADVNSKNYYNESFIDILKNYDSVNTLTKRKNNKKFLKYARKKTNNLN